MGDDRGHTEPLPVVERPAELVDQRSEVERDVGDPSADDDVGAAVERLDDPLAAGVDRRMGQPVADGVQLGAGVEVPERDAVLREVVDAILEIVAEDNRDTETGKAELVGERTDGSGGGSRVRSSGVGDDPYALVDAGLEGALHQIEDVAGVAAVRVGGALLGEDRHRQLGQVVAAEVVDIAALDHLDGRADAVAPEGHAGAEPDDLAGHPAGSPSSRARLSPRMPSISFWVSGRARMAAISAAGSAIGQSDP